MSVRELLLPSLLALVLGAGAAGLVACGDDNGAGLIPAGDAQDVLADLETARDALAGGECDQAARAAGRARSAVAQFPRSVDDRLVRRIEEGLDALEREIRPDCEAEQQQDEVPTTTTTVPETTTETTPTTTETTPPTTETTPTQPPETTPPAQTTPPTTTGFSEPPGTGGVSPDEPEER